MRLNQYIALHTGIGRRSADRLIKEGKVTVNGQAPLIGHQVTQHDKVEVNGLKIKHKIRLITIMLNKPTGYVCSRNGQGSKPVGRLDKDSSGLLLMTNDGKLANELTHPLHQKKKVYEVELDRSLDTKDKEKIEEGVMLEDGLSKLQVAYSDERTADRKDSKEIPERSTLNAARLRVAMFEGRNRQIRRTFAALGYKVENLHRTQFGSYGLQGLTSGNFAAIR
jgi:23S rRNA pseudouridine2605 synthase